MYIKRQLKTSADRAAKGFPAILITGPRQSGKTTFLKEEYGATSHYVSFDDPLQRQFADQDANGFLDQFKDKPVILDEIQYVPQLFSYLKMRIDANRHTLQFLMSGSQQFQLMKNISDSLAGRIAILELHPFSTREILAHDPAVSAAQVLWNGLYPSNIVHSEQRSLWLASYIRTYIQRDVRDLQQIRDLSQFEQFLGLMAASHGQELEASRLSRLVGLSQPGVKKWISVLQASYLVYLLQPYHKNFGKRLVKRPKMYFIDSAIAAYLTRQPSAEALWHSNMGGAFFEGLIVLDALKEISSSGSAAAIYFWRSQDGLEVDMIIEANGRLFPVEIKQTATPTSWHAQGIQRFRKTAGQNCDPGIIVCTTAQKLAMPFGVVALPWQEFHAWLAEQGIVAAG